MTDERHSYTRFTFKPDGTQHVETIALTGDDVRFRHAMVRGDRGTFLELLNNWNRVSARNKATDVPRYIYVADPPYKQDN